MIKDRARNHDVYDSGCYAIVDDRTGGTVLDNSANRSFAFVDLDDVEAWLEQ